MDYQGLLNAVELSISLHNLTPLCRFISYQLASYSSSSKGISIFSSDSFCKPHLEHQLKFYSAIEALKIPVNFLNLPFSHFLSSSPSPDLLSVVNDSDKFLDVHKRLLDGSNISSDIAQIQPSILSDTTVCSRIAHLFYVTADTAFVDLYINGFNFSSLAYRDLSLTYKILPSCCDTNSAYLKICADIVRLNLWTLLSILDSPNLGSICASSNFYSAGGVFLFFCRQTFRKYRYFKTSPFLSSCLNDLVNTETVSILSSPSEPFYLTKPLMRGRITCMKFKYTVSSMFDKYMNERIDGNSPLVYATSAHNSDSTSDKISTLIKNYKSNGSKIVTCFTASSDELAGQQLSFRLDDFDDSHMFNPLWSSQEEWIESLLIYFRQRTDCLFILRFHPRLAADHRGLPRASYIDSYISRLTSKYSHHHIIFLPPESKISSYAVGLNSDLVLNGWSTIGLELAHFNKKVLNAFYLTSLGAGCLYPLPSSVPCFPDKKTYYDCIASCIDDYLYTSPYLLPVASARHAMLAWGYGAQVPLNHDIALLDQLRRPQLITPFFSQTFTY